MSKKIVLCLWLFVLSLFSVQAQDASSTGAFTYSYPINVPAGINGLGPSLSLVYNSQMGNGMLGMGWSLSGLSTVSRDTSYAVNYNSSDHFLLDGQRLIPGDDGYYHTERENFARIELVGNSYWIVTHKNGMKYYYGSTSDSKINAVGYSDPNLWALNKVQDAVGNYYTISYYEDTSNGDFYPQEIKYTYNSSNSGLKLKSVAFSYEARTDYCPVYTPARIEMNRRLKWITVKMDGQLLRKYRLDYEYGNIGGNSRLTSVQEYGNDGNIPPFPYVDSSHTATGSTHPASIFQWNSQSNVKGSSSYFIQSGNDLGYPVIPGTEKSELPVPSRSFFDFDGDGNTDYARLIGMPGDYWLEVTRSNGSGIKDNIYFIHSNDDLGYAKIPGTNVASRHWQDFNGDGKMDYIRLCGTEGNYYYKVTLSTGTGKGSSIYFLTNGDLGYSTIPGTDIPARHWEDFNGDGKVDYIRLAGGSGNLYYVVTLSTGTGQGQDIYFVFDSDDLGYKEIPGTNVPARHWRDFNGDGKVDYIRLAGGSGNLYYVVTLSTGTGKGSTIYFVFDSDDLGYPEIPGTNVPARHWRDFNGDGKLDYIRLVGTSGSYSYKVTLSTGKGKGKSYYFVTDSSDDMGYTEIPDSNLPGRHWLDFDGDGMVDYIRLAGSSSNLYYVVTLSTGRGKGDTLYFVFDSDDLGYVKVPDTDVPGRIWSDFNGDGTLDYIRLGGGSSNLYYKVTFNNYNAHGDFVERIENGTGGIISPYYKQAVSFSGAVQPSSVSYPYRANRSARLLTESIDVNDGVGNISTYNYSYSNGKIYMGASRDKMKSLGFEWFKKTAPDGSYIISYSKQDSSYYGCVDREEFYGANGVLYSVVKNNYSRVQKKAETSSFHSIDFIYNYYIDTYKYNDITPGIWPDTSNALKYRVINYYDSSNGNLTKVYNQHNTAITTDNEITKMSYAYDSAKYLWAVKEVLKYSYPLGSTGGTLESSSNLASKTRYRYYSSSSFSYIYSYGYAGNGVAGEIIHYYKKNGVETTLSETFDYDNYGNLTAHTNARGFTTEITYDDDYAFYPVKTENSKGHALLGSYTTLMYPLTETGFNGQVTEYEYDAFGRISKVAEPGDSIYSPTTRFYYTDTTVPQRVLTYVKDIVTTSSSSAYYFKNYQYFDGLGREIQSKVEAESGYSVEDYHYDNMGRLYKSSIPYNSISYSYNYGNERFSGSRKFSSSGYDSASRLIEKINSDGTRSKLKYGKSSILLLSPEGNLTRFKTLGQESFKYLYETPSEGYFESYWNSIDPDSPGVDEYSTTTYVKAWNGSETIDSEGNLSRVSYDSLGRKLSQTDPVAGIWSYEYDNNGNLTSQTDAKDQTILCDYDSLDRLTKKYTSDGTVLAEMFYDSYGGYSHPGNLIHVSYSTGNETYNYDSRDRVTSISKDIFGEIRTMNFEYDSIDRITKKIYPDGEAVNYSYNRGGNLEAVTGKRNYITDFDYTSAGSLQSMVFGNGVTTTYDYYDSSSEHNSISTEGGQIDTTFSYLLKNLNITNANSETVADISYLYDNTHNILRKQFYSEGLDYTEDFQYDELGRLTSAVNTELFGSKDYEYDNVNRLLQKDERDYFYSNEDANGDTRPHTVSNDGTYKYSYDEMGNMTKREMLLDYAEIERNDPWDMSSASDVKSYHNMSFTSYDSMHDALLYKSTTADPYFYFSLADSIDTSKYTKFKVCFYSSTSGTGQIFWWTESNGWDGSNGFAISSGWQVYEFDLSSYPTENGEGNDIGWTGKVKSFRLDPGSVAGATISLAWATLETDKEGAIGKDFAETERLDPWDMNSSTDVSSTHHMSNVAYSNGVMSFTSTTVDPYFFLKSGGTIDSAKYNKLKFRLYSDEDTTGQLFYYRTAGGLDGSNFFTVSKGWQVYEFDLSSYPTSSGGGDDQGWTGLMNSLRIDPGSKTGLSFKLDYVKLYTNVSSIPEERDITYNVQNKIASISDQGDFTYDADGNVTTKKYGGETVYYFFPEYSETTMGASMSRYKSKIYFANGLRIAQNNYSSYISDPGGDTTDAGLNYLHTDHQGSTIGMTDSSGNIVHSSAYDPFGRMVYASGSESTQYKFTGQEYLNDDLYNYGKRFYDPTLGLFLSPDSHPDDPNRYSYCHFNPVMYNDPDGQVAFIVPVIIGGVIGGVTGGVIAHKKGLKMNEGKFWAHVGVGAAIGAGAGALGHVVAGAGAGSALVGGTSKFATAVAAGIDLALGGAASGFVTGFGNTLAFGGSGTDLFQGNVVEALKMGGISMGYGFVVGFALGFTVEFSAEFFGKLVRNSLENLSIKVPKGNGATHSIKIGKMPWMKKFIDKISNKLVNDLVVSASYNSLNVINILFMMDQEDLATVTNSGASNKSGSLSASTKSSVFFAKVFKPVIWHQETRDSIEDFNFNLSEIKFKLKFKF